MDFINRMIQNLDVFYQNVYGKNFPDQRESSCGMIYDLCVKENPDAVIEVGTCYGSSTLSLMYALKVLNKPMSILTTIDRDHQNWHKSGSEIQKDLLREYGINPGEIRLIRDDFRRIDPRSLIDPDKKYVVFYDIHDEENVSSSPKFFAEWEPLLKNAVVMFHDFNRTETLESVYPSEMSAATSFDGRHYLGYTECKGIIAWVNERKIQIGDFPSGIYFKKKDGKYVSL